MITIFVQTKLKTNSWWPSPPYHQKQIVQWKIKFDFTRNEFKLFNCRSPNHHHFQFSENKIIPPIPHPKIGAIWRRNRDGTSCEEKLMGTINRNIIIFLGTNGKKIYTQVNKITKNAPNSSTCATRMAPFL